LTPQDIEKVFNENVKEKEEKLKKFKVSALVGSTVPREKEIPGIGIVTYRVQTFQNAIELAKSYPNDLSEQQIRGLYWCLSPYDGDLTLDALRSLPWDLVMEMSKVVLEDGFLPMKQRTFQSGLGGIRKPKS